MIMYDIFVCSLDDLVNENIQDLKKESILFSLLFSLTILSIAPLYYFLGNIGIVISVILFLFTMSNQ